MDNQAFRFTRLGFGMLIVLKVLAVVVETLLMKAGLWDNVVVYVDDIFDDVVRLRDVLAKNWFSNEGS